MGVYIDYPDVLAAADEMTIERLTDENSPGTSNQNHVNNLILKREKWFEGYAAFQIGSDLTALRAAQPEEAQRWITAAVVYDLYGRRAVPDYIKEKYLEAREELIAYARTGMPQLIATPSVSAGAQSIQGNMTEADLEVMPWDSDNVKSVWKDVP